MLTIGEADVVTLAARWNATPGSISAVKAGVNAVYRFQTDGLRCFLRITDDRHRDRDQLCAELDFVRFLASRGEAVCEAVPSKSDQTIETMQTADGSLRHAVAFAGAPGRHFRYFSPDIDASLFRMWGAAMGRLHAHSREYTPAPPVHRPAWSAQVPTCCTTSMIPNSEISARREFELVNGSLESFPRTPETWGLIHGDFERTNFLLDAETLWVYDFDDACYHWYVADVAHALWAFRNAPASDRSRFLAWFVEGYAQYSSVPDGVTEWLSWFIRLRSLSLFLHQPTSNAQWAQRMRVGFEKPFWW